ncbi:MAG: succinyl-diaminopimelate desuccinylase [Helicobacteraceae bacterium]|jgi:succinyl-diaminopimelate desuccinylase|nr:succinyl-diaminopimelate desuccinylase [Helicobacteraceae bacterium]
MSVVKLLKELLSRPSVTPCEAGCFALIRDFLPEFTAERFDKNGVSNLLLTRKRSDGAHLCFAGHIDVVPAKAGWRSDPFAPLEQNGRITARGAQDMKSGVAAFLSACKKSAFNGTLSILLTSDEEGAAEFGTAYVLDELKKRDRLPDMAVVAEPTSETVLGDTIKIGRRGSVNGKLTIFGKSGHTAYPQKCKNPIDDLARLLPLISAAKIDDGDRYFPPSVLVISDIRSDNEITNVTPSNIALTFNIRNSTLSDESKIESYIKSALSRAGVKHYELFINSASAPFLTRSKKLFIHLSEAIKETCGIEPAASTAGGTSDARFFAVHNIETIEFGVPNDQIHSANESVEIKDVIKLEEVFIRLIERLSK